MSVKMTLAEELRFRLDRYRAAQQKFNEAGGAFYEYYSHHSTEDSPQLIALHNTMLEAEMNFNNSSRFLAHFIELHEEEIFFV